MNEKRDNRIACFLKFRGNHTYTKIYTLNHFRNFAVSSKKSLCLNSFCVLLKNLCRIDSSEKYYYLRNIELATKKIYLIF